MTLIEPSRTTATQRQQDMCVVKEGAVKANHPELVSIDLASSVTKQFKKVL